MSKISPNDKCPCGSKAKFKRCCGSVAGDLHYFVASAVTESAMESDDGRIMVFTDRAVAAAAAKSKGWLRDEVKAEIIPLSAGRWAKFQSEVPYVLVTVKEFDVTPQEQEAPPPEVPEETPVESQEGVISDAPVEPKGFLMGLKSARGA